MISLKFNKCLSNSFPCYDNLLTYPWRCNNISFISLSNSSKYQSNNQKHWSKLGVKPDEKPGCSTTILEGGIRMKTVINVPNQQTAARTSGGSSEAYMQPKPINIRYNPRMYDGGLLPRLDYTDKQVLLPEHKPRDLWSPHRAYFGQNDYIDILGDGKIKPRDFYTGPPWALGARNEYQRVCSRLNNPAIVAWMEEFEPSKLTAELKLQRYLFKKVNKRKNLTFQRYRDSP
uniref:Large ribosomal subunit protein mL51 n=3 Tax=Schistosoma japonicum TaxID=6182 RepID=C1LEG1_SCHJA|nr:39S ribosomal protein L51, mitochondrial precursor [Schistosoma japonicum]